MRSPIQLFALMVCFLFAGCVECADPFYKEDQLVFDPELSGTWFGQYEQEKDVIVVGDADAKLYSVEVVDPETSKRERLEFRLAKLKDRTIVDFVELPDQADDNRPAKRMHQFAVLTQPDPDTVLIATFNPDWFKKLVESDPAAVKCRAAGFGEYVLTGSVDEIQAFLIKHFDTKEAWLGPIEFRRRPQ